MKLTIFVVPLALVAGAIAFGGVQAFAQAGPPPPSSGKVIASGLSTTGADVGPDGALYIGLAGSGGSKKITLPPEFAAQIGSDFAYFGLSGTVVRVDPKTDKVTTFAKNLPSATTAPGSTEAAGVVDVQWYNGKLYALTTGSINLAEPGYPNGIYRLEDDGFWSVFADISKFNDDNPVKFPDAGPGGNPFALDARGNEFIVSDGNYNRLLRVTADGDISILVSYDNIVPTGLATKDSGPVLNTWFSPGPHNPGDSFLVSVGFPTGNVTKIADTYAQLIDVEFGPGGKTYVLQFGDQSFDETGDVPPPPGRLLVLDGGKLLPLVTGLTLATSLNFSGDTAYITSLTGELVKIDGVSALQPIIEPTAVPTKAPPTPAPPTPMPTRPTGIGAPDTGSAGFGDAAGSTPWLGVLALVLGGVVLAGGTVVFGRRS